METKMITIPFDIELAKKIQNGKHPGKIETRDGKNVRVLCFDAFNAYPLVVLINDGNSECSEMYNENGQKSWIKEKGQQDDLVFKVPDWTQFKDGDILACENHHGTNYCKWFSILSGEVGLMENFIQFRSYVSYDYDTSSRTEELEYDEYVDYPGSIRLATDEEKQRFIKRLKEVNTDKAKDILKRFFGIEEKSEHEFQPFDKVLVRNGSKDVWFCNILSHLSLNKLDFYPFKCIDGGYRQCIPYNEQTKHLVGTTDDWEEE